MQKIFKKMLINVLGFLVFYFFTSLTCGVFAVGVLDPIKDELFNEKTKCSALSREPCEEKLR